MDYYLRDEDILDMLGEGSNSDIEFGEDESEENLTLGEYILPRIRQIEEEIVQEEEFNNMINNYLNTVDDVIESVARGDIGLETLERRPTVFDYITEPKEISWEKIMFTTRQPPVWTRPEIANAIHTPLQYFLRYIPRSVFESASYNTNLYASQQNNLRFKPCITEEIETLFGLHLAMGSLGFPRARMYWSQDIGLNLFLDNMTRDRFFSLRSHLHFVNNLEKPADCQDKFYKVRPLYDSIRNRCLELNLTKQLSIDEQMIPFTGNMQGKQFVRGKPNPSGLKNVVLCGSNGLPFDFLLYQGKTTEVNPDHKELGVSASVVLKLCERIETKGTELFFDNYFNSYKLLQVLKAKEIFSGGTANISRFYKPPLLDNKK